jgi:elongator complex protein 1
MTPPQDFGVVAVVDGQTIKITPFQAANIPPPMALHEFEVHSNAIDVAINGDASSIAVLHQQGISVFEWKRVSRSGSGPALTGRFTFEKETSSDATYQQVSFSEENQVVVLQRVKTGSIIKRYGFDNDTGRMEEKPPADNPTSIISALSSFSRRDSSNSYAQGPSGDLHNLVFGGQSLAHCKFPVQLPWMEIVPHGDDHIAFGMSSNGHLYANSHLLVKNCTSFLVTPAHLIFTTTTHLLKFVHITSAQGTLRSCQDLYTKLTLSRP